MKKFIILTLLMFCSSSFSQTSLNIFNNTNYKIRIQVLSLGSPNDCNVQLMNPDNNYIFLLPQEANLFYNYSDFSYSSWKRSINNVFDSITPQQADALYSINWEYIKIDVYNNRTNVLLFSFGLGSDICIYNPQSFSNGTFNATWNISGNDYFVTLTE